MCYQTKIQQQIVKAMIADEQRTLQLLEPLIKIIKEREGLYFQALSFATKNIESSSSDIDQIAIFTNFLITTSDFDAEIVMRETMLFSRVGPCEDPPSDGYKVPSTSKQMMRLSARVFEILQSSIEKARNTLFNENGRLGIDFTRFKKALHRTIRQQTIDLSEFSSVIINFVKNKYRRQISRVRNYLNRLQAGQHISLRDLFTRQGSDASVSPEQRPHKLNKSIRPMKKLLKQSSPECQSPSKRQSTKKVIQGIGKIKRTLNLKTTKREQYQYEQQHGKKQKKMQKSATAAMLLKFYSMMELNKKQFLEDYIFEKHEQEKHRKRLITELMEKNVKNADQIKEYFMKCQHYNPSLHNLHVSSDQRQESIYRNQSSVNSKASMKTSFVISKRKGSFILEQPSDRSDVQHNIMPLSRTIKNFSHTKRTPQKKQGPSRPKQSGNSKRIFVIKSPMNFDDEVIPKVEMSNAAWIQAPLTGRDKNRRNQHIRLKKRNNPVPLDEKYLPDSFRLSHYPI